MHSQHLNITQERKTRWSFIDFAAWCEICESVTFASTEKFTKGIHLVVEQNVHSVFRGKRDTIGAHPACTWIPMQTFTFLCHNMQGKNKLKFAHVHITLPFSAVKYICLILIFFLLLTLDYHCVIRLLLPPGGYQWKEPTGSTLKARILASQIGRQIP